MEYLDDEVKPLQQAETELGFHNYSYSFNDKVKIQAFEKQFVEVIDMEDEFEPIPARIDHYVSKYAKLKSP